MKKRGEKYVCLLLGNSKKSGLYRERTKKYRKYGEGLAERGTDLCTELQTL